MALNYSAHLCINIDKSKALGEFRQVLKNLLHINQNHVVLRASSPFVFLNFTIYTKPQNTVDPLFPTAFHLLSQVGNRRAELGSTYYGDIPMSNLHQFFVVSQLEKTVSRNVKLSIKR